MNRVKGAVRDFIRNEMGGDVGEADLKDDDSLLDAGLIDSLGIQKLMVFLEDKFRIRISDEEITPDNFETVTRISEMIEAKLSR